MRFGRGQLLARHKNLVTSQAFRDASLRSEVRRAYGVIGVVVLIIFLILKRAANQELSTRVQDAAAVGLGALLLIQIGMLVFVMWAERNDRGVPGWFLAIVVTLECLIPTGILASNIAFTTLPPYASLSSPPIFAYTIMILLTTLRLRPSLCILAGTVGLIGYGAIVAYVTFIMKITTPTTGLPYSAYTATASLIFITGLAAAWVTLELRTHVEAALGEAETHRKMDRIEQDLSLARSIQRALLPKSPPTIPGYDIAGWNQPADQTGGDYFDWQILPDGKWIVTLADVSGHGIGPALVTAACRAYVRASRYRQCDLGYLTARVNRLLSDDLPAGRFVTMVSLLINPAGGPIALLSAGHGPIMLYAKGGANTEEIKPTDLPLAVQSDATFGPAQPISMKEGDVLALITDGFVEWAKRDSEGKRDEFGLLRLRESLCRHAHLPAAEIIEAITADVTDFAKDTPQQDDLTMVIVKRV